MLDIFLESFAPCEPAVSWNIEGGKEFQAAGRERGPGKRLANPTIRALGQQEIPASPSSGLPAGQWTWKPR